ncbi:hypothetical protein [Brucella sp. 63/311]|uniref:hypothetical protein n=1 Tax=Brucella sp. 63/311 TaxID=1160235 RepID=UPI0002CEBEBA|nr:hypothetical protein [Brucella sp. 63/311]ENT06524.1 hypothetical protein C038_00484 [Brucella sp. 63/311]
MNTQDAQGSVDSKATTSIVNLDQTALETGGLVDVTATTTTRAGLALNGSTNAGSPALNQSRASLAGNITQAIAQGNAATNELNYLGAQYRSPGDQAKVELGTGASRSKVQAAAALYNQQSNTGTVKAESDGASYRIALNASTGKLGIADGSIAVTGNQIGVSAAGNGAVNKIALTGLNAGIPTAAIGSNQVNAGAITATVTDARIGVGTSGLVSGASIKVGNNSISASAVGNSVSNAISRANR